MQRISPFLWFAEEAEEAARFYVSVFKNSKVIGVARYGEAGTEIHGRAPGSVMTVEFELDGQKFTALNGGPHFKFNESVSFVVSCETQAEIDDYWTKLTAGGDPAAQQCGWLKDRYGVSWQVVPSVLAKFVRVGGGVANGVMVALLKMKKLDMAELEKAARMNADHTKPPPGGQRVRVPYRGELVADSAEALAMREGSHPVASYTPRKDVKMERLERTSHKTHCPF